MRISAQCFSLLLLAQLIGCAYFAPKSGQLHQRPPKGSPWSIQKIMNNSVLFENGVQIDNIGHGLKYRDAFTNPAQPTQITYLLEGSPCQNCDGIRSMYILNPALGKAKLAFLPGNYYASDPQTAERHLEFRGELYYGKCLDELRSGVFLYKETHQKDDSGNTQLVQQLIFLSSFQENYLAKNLDLNEVSKLQAASKHAGKSCYQLQGAKDIQIPM